MARLVLWAAVNEFSDAKCSLIRVIGPYVLTANFEGRFIPLNSHAKRIFLFLDAVDMTWSHSFVILFDLSCKAFIDSNFSDHPLKFPNTRSDRFLRIRRLFISHFHTQLCFILIQWAVVLLPNAFVAFGLTSSSVPITIAFFCVQYHRG